VQAEAGGFDEEETTMDLLSPEHRRTLNDKQAGLDTPKMKLQGDNAVAETLLIPLYARAVEARQPVPLVLDDRAATLVESIDYDFARFRLHGHDQVTIIMRLREFDRRTQDFLARHPQAVVVHIGCGLDTRFERVDNGQVTWYNLDLPQVIALRRKLVRESERCRCLGCSVFEESWLDAVGVHAPRPFLFLAEAVFPYFAEAQVKRLFLGLMQRFPGAELVCDAMTPLMVRLNNLQLRTMQIGARLHWGLRHGRDPESWGEGIQLLDQWSYFERREPRLGAMYLMRYFPPFAKGVGIFHYRLGGPQ
jgi:O-methyltransferase involved in polyketide biosynthesis